MIVTGITNFKFETPTEPIMINSEFLIKNINAAKDPKKATIGKIKDVRFRKLYNDNCITILKGTFLPVDFLNCSTKSPIISSVANIIKTIKNDEINFLVK